VKGALAGVAELVRRHTGISLPAARETALVTALERAAPGLGPAGFLAAAADPVRGRVLLERLIDEVTVQETSFVRDRDQLDLIPWHSLCEGAGAQRGGALGADVVRVWSAGCASGEEAYTLALLASEAFLPSLPPVDVLGTDISGAALAAAAAGHYRERAVRGLAAPLRQRYLMPQPDGTYLAGGRLRRLVRFSRHNLARDPVPPLGEAAFDLVVCRNVLIYFDTGLAARVIRSLERALNPGGMLVLGAADALQRAAAGGDPGAAGPAAGGTRAPRPQTRQVRAAARGGTFAIPAPEPGHLRRPLGRPPASPPQPASRQQRLTTALEAAGKGDRDAALAHVTSLLTEDPLDADAHFVQGLVALEASEPAQAAAALRRALYTDPSYALAAFTLGRAYDALGDWGAARRAYAQALRTLDPTDRRHDPMLGQIDLADIAAACHARLKGRK
jgi:chemotaxis protein methyltransferase CheR